MSAARRPRSSGPRVLGRLGLFVLVSAMTGVLVAGLAVPFAALAGLGARSVAEGMEDLPERLTAEPLAQRTRVLAADGSLLTTLYSQNRVNIPLNRVALTMRKAIVAIEDYRFYQHGALDLKGTLRAFITNQANSGVVQGGSSITQQMVKQTLVAQADTKAQIAAATADTYERKFNELRYAIAFEERYSKDWILERYLNVSYFGDGAYGIEAAAEHYFSKPAARLTLPEAALLAGVVKNPSQYDPTNNRGASKARRNVVLDRMAELHVISRSEARRASRAGLGLRVSPTRNGCVGTLGEFFCDYVREFLEKDPRLGRTAGERRQLLLTGGLTIRTTIGPRFQRAADAAVRSHVRPTDQAIGGMAMVVPGTGEVRAVAQSRPMGSNRAKGQTFLNYVVPKEYGDSNGFQAGSTFKAFVLAAALKQGIPLSTRIRAPESRVMEPEQFTTCDGPYFGDPWTVGNSGGSGTYNLYDGTKNSVNTFFAELESRTGLCDPVTLARDMGVAVPDSDIVGPFTLGVTDTNPLTMASAYATFAARGSHCTPHPVNEVRDSRGRVIADYDGDCEQLLPQPVADAVNDVLSGVQEPGGFGYNEGLQLEQQSAAKTGTIQNNKAVWYVGYTPNLSTAAMLAGANSLGHPITLNGQVVNGSFIAEAFGSTYAGPIWGQAMQTVDNFLPDVSFVPPDPNAILGRPAVVPDVQGMSAEEAALQLRAAGFVPTVGSYVDSTLTKGAIASTTPIAGATIGTGSAVTLNVSDGTAVRGRPAPDDDEQ
jgi:membrane peptidoglycan carboxypeptidase